MAEWFVTGTDTGCGKTAVSVALLKALQARGTVCGYKPVAAGCEEAGKAWINEDGFALMHASKPTPTYLEVNPYPLPDAIAPHIAAKRAAVPIEPSVLADGFESLNGKYDYVVVEGAGGWHVPLSLEDDWWFSDLPKQLGLPVILVVGVKLGCINHATLTANAILQSGCRLVGWVANVVEPDMPVQAENVATLQSVLGDKLGVPQIAQFDYVSGGVLPAGKINLDALLR